MTAGPHWAAMLTASALLALPLLALGQGHPDRRDAAGGLLTQTTTTAPVTSSAAVDASALQNGRRASKLVGSTVYNENNESIGEVDDIVIPRDGGAPVVVLSVGGFLGIGSRLVAVPFDRLRLGQNDRWTMSGVTRDSLTALPAFTYPSATPG